MRKISLLISVLALAIVPSIALATKDGVKNADAYVEIDEHEKLFYGYDVTAGKSLSSMDAFKTLPIISKTKSVIFADQSSKTYNEIIEKRKGNTEQESKSFTATSLTTLVSDYSQSLGVGVSMGLASKISMDVESCFNLNRSVSNVVSSYYEMMSTIIKRYYYVVPLDTANISDFLDDAFVTELKKVDSTTTGKALFKRYGTHLLTGYIMGGIMNITNYKTTSDSSKNFSTDTALSEKLSAAVGSISAGQSFSFSQNYGTYENQSTATSTYSYKSYGGVPTSSLTLDGLFTYNPSITDVEKAGFMYTTWINSIKNDKDLSVIAIPENASSIPLWSFADYLDGVDNATKTIIKTNLINAFVEIAGDRYDEYMSAYAERPRSLDYKPDIDGVSSVVNGAYIRTSKDFVYYVDGEDFNTNGEHYSVKNGDILYFNLERYTPSYYATFNKEKSINCEEALDNEGTVFKVTKPSTPGSIDRFRIVIDYGSGTSKKSSTLIDVPIKSDSFDGGTGSEKYPFFITTTNQFELIPSYSTSNFKLMKDLDFASVNHSVTINSLDGSIDGNYCKIRNIQIQDSLVNMIRENGKISNLALVSPSFTAVSEENIGILCGTNNGTIDGVAISDCNKIGISKNVSNNGTVKLNLGAVCGLNKGTIQNCAVEDFSTNILITHGTSPTDGAGLINVNVFVGGISGYTEEGKIIGCAVINPTIYAKLITSTVEKVSTLYMYFGGISGLVSGRSTVKNCFAEVGAVAFDSAIIQHDKLSSYQFAHNFKSGSATLRSAMYVEATNESILGGTTTSIASEKLYSQVIMETFIAKKNLTFDVVCKKDSTYNFSSNFYSNIYWLAGTSTCPWPYQSETTELMNVANKVSAFSSSVFYNTGLSSKYFTLNSSGSGLEFVLLENKSSFISAYFIDAQDDFKVYKGEKFKLPQMSVILTINGQSEETNSWIISLNEIGANEEITEYNFTGSLYKDEGSEKVAFGPSHKIVLEEETINEVYVDNPNDDIFVYYDQRQVFIDTFNYDTFTNYTRGDEEKASLKAFLTNNMSIVLDGDDTYLKNAKLKLLITKADQISLGDNIISFTYGNSSKKFEVSFVIHCIERDIVEECSGTLILQEESSYVSGQLFDINDCIIEVTYLDTDTEEKEKIIYLGTNLSLDDNKVSDKIKSINDTYKSEHPGLPEDFSLKVQSLSLIEVGVIDFKQSSDGSNNLVTAYVRDYKHTFDISVGKKVFTTQKALYSHIDTAEEAAAKTIEAAANNKSLGYLYYVIPACIVVASLIGFIGYKIYKKQH